eukprot:Em0014g750a
MAMPLGGPRQQTPRDPASPHPAANVTKSALQMSVVSSGGGDANYNYVSWELLNQPSADDDSVKRANLHNGDATPTDVLPNSYLKITHMSGPPSQPHPPPSPEPHPSSHTIGTPMCLKSPQTEAPFFPDDIPIVPDGPPYPKQRQEDKQSRYKQ